MKLAIKYSATWYNLNRLRDYVSAWTTDHSNISLLIDCATGKINIPQPIAELESALSFKKGRGAQQYLHAELVIRAAQAGALSFALREEIALRGVAQKVIQEMIDLLNLVGRQIHTGSVKEVLFDFFRSAKIDLAPEMQSQPGWVGTIDRVSAERLLEKAPPGTYLLRDGDETSQRIEQALAEAYPFPVRSFLMTLAEESGKISDKLLIQRGDGWAIYNDDFDLADYTFQTLAEAIALAGGRFPFKGAGKVA